MFIQQVIQAFHELPETHESKTPRDWVDRVEQLMLHFRGNHENCGILERFGFEMIVFIEIDFLKNSNLEPPIRCLDYNEGTKSTPIFDQLMRNDQKKGKKMTDTLSQKLTDLLVGDEKCDMAEIICSLGSTSACESNHSRIVTRGIHRKGSTFI